MTSDIEIPGENLIVRAADAVLAELGFCASVDFALTKRIPLGAGMGGGSADAAAVLRVLPDLLNKSIPAERLSEIGAGLGSDVPFFLLGGTALGLDRGTELYPLPDLPRVAVLIVMPDVHVSTAEAYRALKRTPDYVAPTNVTERFARAIPAGSWHRWCSNDFEQAVLARHPDLESVRRKLSRAGARAARMTGSGAALFGVFDSAAARDGAAVRFAGQRVFKSTFLPRNRVVTSELSTRKGA